MIICKNVSQKYKSNTVLSNINLELKTGVYGLIGENGAGKSTLLKLLIGQISPREGSIRISGKDPKVGKMDMGYLPQKFDFFQNISLYDSLEYVGILKGIHKDKLPLEIEYWLKKMNLLSERKKRVGLLSGGMKQRLGIAQAFIGAPKYVLLDEPTVGLDPRERLAFRNLVNEIGSDKVILISTHIVEDVRATCENIIVLKKGSLLFTGATEDFISGVNKKIYTVHIPKNQLSSLSSCLDIISIKLFGEVLEVRFAENEYSLELKDKKQETCNLEDAYFLTTGMSYKKEEN
ncbi:ATP-binding cassette domain-containing protein [Lachnospiraceae bacterium OttesenSCG-928-D06]|nr:ATP-binding cassette domain-containing protein [Lachnospiraceae bacterium OttesenSCG-928-D06]